MQDNFNMHNWRLKQALKELEEKTLCKECGSGYMEEGQCNECGYMEEAATFTDKFDDNPELKGGQKDLPDELQAQILKKEGLSKEEIKKKCITIAKRKHKAFPSVKATSDIMACTRGEIWADEIKKLNEDEDHEVFMAKRSLQSIMSSCSKLMVMLGDEERNIPGWIQDHIVNAENYIDQAAQGFYELDNNNEEN